MNGTTFYRIYEADVCLQDGYCDYFQDPVSLREVITHELGHCLGLAHSDDRTASMAPYIHNDGRGEHIRPDDMNGARFIYPGTPGGGGGEGDGEPPTISTTTLPDATIGVGYTKALTVANGKDPFAWDLAAGSLPPGLTLSAGGALAGVPTLAGTYTFQIRVTDSVGRVDSRLLSLRVHVPPPVILAASYRKNKHQLTVVGTNFAESAQFEINGQIAAPRKAPQYNSSAGTFTIKGSRKQLHLNKGVGTNHIVVIVDDERSGAYTF